MSENVKYYLLAFCAFMLGTLIAYLLYELVGKIGIAVAEKRLQEGQALMCEDCERLQALRRENKSLVEENKGWYDAYLDCERRLAELHIEQLRKERNKDEV